MLRMTAALCCLALVLAAGCSTKKPASTPAPTPTASPSATAPATAPVPPTPTATTSPPASPASPAASRVPPPPGALAQSISFVSLDEAWVLAKASGTTIVLHTVDRGAHWSEVGTIPAAVGSSAGDVKEIRFANPQDGWAFDPALYATTNGGASWHPVSLPGQVAGLEASASTAWAVVNPCNGAASCSTPGSLERAAAGSDSWQPVAGVSLPAMSVGSAEIGLQNSAVYLLMATVLLASANGSTFSTVNSPCPSGSTASHMAVSTPTNLAVLCSGGAAAGSSAKQVYVSANAGQTFTRIAQAPLGGEPIAMAAGSPTTIAIAAASGASWVYTTQGADTTWFTPLTFGDGGAGWGDLGFTDATHGVVIHGPGLPGDGVVYLTSNGGASWYAIPLAA
jgi:hypothetical protein